MDLAQADFEIRASGLSAGLSAEEERQLFARVGAGCRQLESGHMLLTADALEARAVLAIHYLKLVGQIAAPYRNMSRRVEKGPFTAMDFEAEGMRELLESIPLYDASKGASFRTWAAVRIRGAMRDMLRRYSDGVRLPRGGAAILRRVEIAAGVLRQRNGCEPGLPLLCREIQRREISLRCRKLNRPLEPQEISRIKARFSPSRVGETLSNKIRDISFQKIENADDAWLYRQGLAVERDCSQLYADERLKLRRELHHALQELKPGPQGVIRLLFGFGAEGDEQEPLSGDEVAARLGRTKGRVSQIKTKGLQALRENETLSRIHDEY